MCEGQRGKVYSLWDHKATSLCSDWLGGRPQPCTLEWQSHGLHVPKEVARQPAPLTGGGGADMEGRKRPTRQTGSVLRGGFPALPWGGPNQNLLLPLAGKGQGSVQAVGDTEGGMHRQRVQEQ